VAILDADKEGFLRAERSLIQTIGRAARHVNGQAIMYADTMTDSMEKAIAETERRRKIQLEYNRQHNITPQPIEKKSDNSILAFLEVSRRLQQGSEEVSPAETDEVPLEEIPNLIDQLQEQMNTAAQDLEFEKAAELRDRIQTLRDKLLGR
jgi:excinuclease ABC subunit B